MGLVLYFLAKSLFFLLCSGIRYLASNLLRELTNLAMKALSLRLVLSKVVVSDITVLGELGLSAKVWSWLDKVKGRGVEALIDAPSCEEASEVQIVQLDIERWYLLFVNTNSATFFLSWPTSSFRMTTLAAASS